MRRVSKNITLVVIVIAYLTIVILSGVLLLIVLFENFAMWHGTGAEANFKSDCGFFVEVVLATVLFIDGVRLVFSQKYRHRTIKHIILSAIFVAIALSLYMFVFQVFWRDLRWVF